jgi:hypothetical protein
MVFYPGWKVTYQEASGEEKFHFEVPYGAKLVADFVNREEANGGTIKLIVFYANQSLGRSKPFYERAITRDGLERIDDLWVEEMIRTITVIDNSQNLNT